MKSKVIMPTAAPLAKIEATKDYGADNDYDIIAEQGTIPKRHDVAYQRIYIACELRREEHYNSVYSK